MSEKRIFRQAALDRLASPEQLDHLVPVADAPGWIALSACALLALALLAWSFAGSLPTTLAARGSVTDGGHALLHVPATLAGAIRPGMEVVLLPAHAAFDRAAASHGTVERIVAAPAGHAPADMHEVHVALPAAMHAAGTRIDADIVLSRRRPIALLIPAWQ